MHHNLDKIDVAILNILQKDCLVPVKDIAQQVGLSTTPTYERIKQMETNGIIKKYVTILDADKAGFQLIVYCNITLKEQSKRSLIDFENAVAKIPEVQEIISLSGVYDYMLKIVSKDIASYNNFVVNTLSNIPNIGQYHSNIVMSMPKHETAYPVTVED